MGESGMLTPGEFRLESADSGWLLRVMPPRVSWTAFIPRTVRGWISLSIGLLISLFVLSIFTPRLGSQMASPTPVRVGFFLIWLLGGTALWWKISPPPIAAEYRRANSEFRVQVDGTQFDNGGGVYHVSHLSTLREVDEWALPGRVRLVFTGAAVPDAEFIGWPGLPPDLAAAVRRAVLDQLAHDSEAEADAAER